jgi:hypothetical protein
MGRSWRRITNGLPPGVYVHVVREDPVRRGLLVAGTERGAFVSLDDGDSWQPLQLNLPVTSVRDFEIYGTDLIVATHGRGIWVVDDVSPLRQMDDTILKSDVYLFKPADVVNVLQGDDNGTPLQKDEPQAPNPPSGAAIDYYLRSAAAGPVTLDILDAGGTVVHAFTSEPQRQPAPARADSGLPRVSPLWETAPEPLPKTAGVHRVVWAPAVEKQVAGDYEPTTQTTHLAGTFTAKLTANGRSYTQRFTVKPDPRGAPR